MNESHKGVCPNCKRLNSKHNDEEFLICTRKIMEDLILANEKWGNGKRQLPLTVDEALSFTLDFDRVQTLLNNDYSKTRISCRILDLPFEPVPVQIINFSSDIFILEIINFFSLK